MTVAKSVTLCVTVESCLVLHSVLHTVLHGMLHSMLQGSNHNHIMKGAKWLHYVAPIAPKATAKACAFPFAHKGKEGSEPC